MCAIILAVYTDPKELFESKSIATPHEINKFVSQYMSQIFATFEAKKYENFYCAVASRAFFVVVLKTVGEFFQAKDIIGRLETE
jgi:hypothetical protein